MTKKQQIEFQTIHVEYEKNLINISNLHQTLSKISKSIIEDEKNAIQMLKNPLLQNIKSNYIVSNS